MDSVRRNKRSPVHVLSVLGEDASVLEPASPEPGPAERTDSSLLRERLERALRVLSPVDQALLVLRELEGYSLSEIGEITELPQSTLKSRLHRARIKLGRLLERAEYEFTQNSGEERYELQRRRKPAG